MLDRIKAVAAEVQHYYLVISTLALALLTILLLRKNSQVSDLQRQIIQDKMNAQLHDALTKAEEDTDSYEKAKDKYLRIKQSYNRLYNE